MKMKMMMLAMMFTFCMATNASAIDPALVKAAGAAAKGVGSAVGGFGNAVGDIAKGLTGYHKAPDIGGNATAIAKINGVGGIVNVGVNVAGAVDSKQTVAGILSGKVSGNATAQVQINGVGGIVNVGVAVGGLNFTCQSVGTIGGSGC